MSETHRLLTNPRTPCSLNMFKPGRRSTPLRGRPKDEENIRVESDHVVSATGCRADRFDLKMLGHEAKANMCSIPSCCNTTHANVMAGRTQLVSASNCLRGKRQLRMGCSNPSQQGGQTTASNFSQLCRQQALLRAMRLDKVVHLPRNREHSEKEGDARHHLAALRRNAIGKGN